jgi:hypothetical protein
MNFCLIYIVDEAHENTSTSSHKKVSDHNPDYLPTNVAINILDLIILLS